MTLWLDLFAAFITGAAFTLAAICGAFYLRVRAFTRRRGGYLPSDSGIPMRSSSTRS